MKLRFSDTAEQDLLETLSYYKAPSAMGDVFNTTIASAVNHLQQWPNTGHRRRDLTPKDVCFWFEPPYMFVLQIRDNTIFIVAVLHSSRNISKILRTRLKKVRPTT